MRWRLLFLCCLAASGLFGQHRIDWNAGRVVERGFCDTIPFELVKNKMIVTANIGGKSRRLIVDTGALLCIDDDLQAELRFDTLKKVDVLDANQIKKTQSVVRVDTVRLGKLTFVETPAIIFDFDKMLFVSCFDVDGFIGSNLLKNCITHIDVAKKQLVLTDDISRLPLQNAVQMPITLDKQSGPHITYAVNAKIKFTALFDSGDDDFLTISDKTAKKLLKNGYIKCINEGVGAKSVGAHGVENSKAHQRWLAESWTFGKQFIENLTFDTKEGSKEERWGMEMGQYGAITIDYGNKAFYLKMYGDKQAYKRTKTFGFTPGLQPDHYSVGFIWSNSPASKINLKSSYKLLSIDNLDIQKRTPETDCALILGNYFQKQTLTIRYLDEQNTIQEITLQCE